MGVQYQERLMGVQYQERLIGMQFLVTRFIHIHFLFQHKLIKNRVTRAVNQTLTYDY